MEHIIAQLSLLILVVLVISLIMRLFRQPLIIGYIISGILSGPLFLDIIKDPNLIKGFSELGISFLLFLVGLHLSPRVIKEVGKISLVTGAGQLLFTSIIGYFLSVRLGFAPLTALYISIALTFSSTIIIMKLLSDRDDMEKLYAKISIGFLLVQDFAAIIALIVISSLAHGTGAGILIFTSLLKGLFLIFVLSLFTRYVLLRITGFLAESQEFFFLFVIVWGLGLSFLFQHAGLSMEVGALIAGVLIAATAYSQAIASKLKVLRDFFIIFFFITLGSQMVFGQVEDLILPAIILSLFILIGNPLIVMVLMGIFKYTKRTGFQAGLTVAQISEFSLILIALGVRVGHLSGEILSFVTFIGLLTIAGSTYLIMYSERIYEKISKFLSVFERKQLLEREMLAKNFDYILIGYNRTGFSILKTFEKLSEKFLVIEINPDIVHKLKGKGLNCIYGDADDSELLESLKLYQVKLVVSTVPDLNTNMLLLKKIRGKNRQNIVVVTARQISEAFALYDEGADYVILPHFLGSSYTANLIDEFKLNKGRYKEERAKQMYELRERAIAGQELSLFEHEGDK